MGIPLGKRIGQKNLGEIPFIWSRVGDPSDALLRLYSRIFTDILGEQDSSPSEEDDHTEAGELEKGYLPKLSNPGSV